MLVLSFTLMIRDEKSVNTSLLVRAWSSDNMFIMLIVV